MSYELYKVIHLVSIFVFVIFSAYSVAAGPSKKNMIITGVAAFFILFGGMGLMARLGIASLWPTWTIVKVIIWLAAVGAGHLLAKRMSDKPMVRLVVMLTIVSLGAIVASFKPFG